MCRYSTDFFTEMDKVLLQVENDCAAQDKWHSCVQNNERSTFMLLFEKDFPNMAAARYEWSKEFFVKLFSEPAMMQQVTETVGHSCMSDFGTLLKLRTDPNCKKETFL